MAQALALTSKEINRVLKIILLMKNPESKRASIVLGHVSLRVTEIALIQTKTLLMPNGDIRSEVFLPAKICKNCRPRTVWLSEKAKAVLQEWIDFRLSKKWGVLLPNDTRYQGLNPESKFIYNNRGRSFSLQPKPRKLESGLIKEYWAADSLEQSIRNIYRKCGLKTSSHCGRRSLATNSVLSGVPLETVSRMLGHSSCEVTLIYIQIDKGRLKEMLATDWI